AVFWVKGLRQSLQLRFLLRLSLWALAGFGVYLLLPLWQSLPLVDHVGFWPALKANLKSEKTALLHLRGSEYRILVFTALLPFLLLAIRWRSHTAQRSDDSKLGVFLIKATGHVAHGLMLLLAIWIALDPAFGPRALGLGGPMLSYYFLWALVAGY